MVSIAAGLAGTLEGNEEGDPAEVEGRSECRRERQSAFCVAGASSCVVSDPLELPTYFSTLSSSETRRRTSAMRRGTLLET